jgi:integrase
MPEKEARIATTRRNRPTPTVDQIRRVIACMPHGSDIEQRDRALIAFILLTGMRDTAVASLKLKHVNLLAGSVYQDAREVRTKFSKTFTTYFFPVGEDIRRIVEDWINHLRTERLWGEDDALSPRTNVVLGINRQFEPSGSFASGSQRRAYRTSTRTASAAHWFGWARPSAIAQRSSRPGAKI